MSLSSKANSIIVDLVQIRSRYLSRRTRYPSLFFTFSSISDQKRCSHFSSHPGSRPIPIVNYFSENTRSISRNSCGSLSFNLDRSSFSLKRYFTTNPELPESIIEKMACPLDEKTAKEIIQNTDTFLFDCDGVLWNTDGVIDGSSETISKLKELGKKVFYVTNNSSKSRQQLLDKCKQLGFMAEKEDVVCTSYIAAAYLKQLKFDGTVYLMGKPDSIGEELNQIGVDYVGTGPDPIEGTVEDWLKLSVDKKVNCVLVGFDPDISYMKILRAATHLRNPDCLFLATNLDTNLPTTANVTIPGTGCMVVTVSHAARRKPLVMGKPEVLMFDVLKQEFNLDPARCLMVGDMLSTDVKFAENCGMKSLLVLSGNTMLEDTKKADCPAVPDLYAPCLGELLKYI